MNKQQRSGVAAALYDLVGISVRALMHDRDLSLTSAATLATLRREGPQRLSALAAAEGVSQPSMTQLVQRLEGRGLVERHADPHDGRVTLVAITEPGTAAVRERRKVGEERLADLLVDVPDADLRALRDTIAAVLPELRARETGSTLLRA